MELRKEPRHLFVTALIWTSALSSQQLLLRTHLNQRNESVTYLLDEYFRLATLAKKSA